MSKQATNKQNPNAVYNVIAFVFADRTTAKQVSSEVSSLKGEAADAGYKIVANAVVDMDEKGKENINPMMAAMIEGARAAQVKKDEK